MGASHDQIVSRIDGTSHSLSDHKQMASGSGGAYGTRPPTETAWVQSVAMANWER